MAYRWPITRAGGRLAVVFGGAAQVALVSLRAWWHSPLPAAYPQPAYQWPAYPPHGPQPLLTASLESRSVTMALTPVRT